MEFALQNIFWGWCHIILMTAVVQPRHQLVLGFIAFSAHSSPAGPGKMFPKICETSLYPKWLGGVLDSGKLTPSNGKSTMNEDVFPIKIWVGFPLLIVSLPEGRYLEDTVGPRDPLFFLIDPLDVTFGQGKWLLCGSRFWHLGDLWKGETNSAKRTWQKSRALWGIYCLLGVI